jgi:prevent-host-death family protein
MDNSINASEFKAKCLSLIDEVALTGRPLTITKRGKIVAQLVPPPASLTGYPQDSLFGTVTVTGDILEPVIESSDILLEEGYYEIPPGHPHPNLVVSEEPSTDI